MGRLSLHAGNRSVGRRGSVLDLRLPPVQWTPSADLERGHFVGPSTHADVSVVVVTYNSAPDIGKLIDGLRVAAHDRPLRLIVVDNGSSDGTVELLQLEEDVVFLESGGNIGYAAALNVGFHVTEDCDAVLFLNPDLVIARDTLTLLLEALDGDRVGAAAPLILEEDGVIFPSLLHEPSLIRCLCDGVFGRNLSSRLGLPSEQDIRSESYVVPHEVDWAMGAAVLVPTDVARRVGPWNEDFFLYAEEIDYMRRIRRLGLRIQFQPSAMVRHRGGGSGSSPDLEALRAVNRVRYIELYHGRAYSAAFRAAVALKHSLRSYRAVDRHILAFLLRRRRWTELPAREAPSSPS